jgi:CheY-like chemotaxis protein
MATGGRMTIGVSREQVPADARRGEPGGDVPPGSYAVLTVRDTGTGMDAATKARLFEPFFTTKPVGHGTGLGLATVYGIVRQSGGFIRVASEAGAGAEFRIFLPLVDASEPAGTGAAPSAPGGKQETVLVVDDEPTVLRFLERLLGGAGYTVQTAGSAAEALERIAGLRGRLDLMITDIVMPGMSGRELGERVTQRHPQIRVLYTSGYAGDEATRRGLLADGAAFIEKPLDPDVLLSRIRTLVDGAVPQPVDAAGKPAAQLTAPRAEA